jgi:cytochrome c-type biogenesis protein CcmH
MIARISAVVFVFFPAWHAVRNSPIGGQFRAFYVQAARYCLSFIAAFIISLNTAHAQTSTPAMPAAAPELEARLKKLETELRCLVCQNQTLAESPAGLAGDLRREIRILADAGKSNEEIKMHLKDRYGDFVLYKPVVDSKTYVLWFGPFAMLLGGALLVFFVARKRRGGVQTVVETDTASLERAQSLLRGDSTRS